MTEVLEVPGPDGPLGWVAVDSVVGGLAFGGLRVSPGVTRRDVEDLARTMTWKLAGHGLPVGGAKAGLRADPGDPRLGEALERLARAAAPLLTTRVVLGRDAGASDAALDALYAALGRPQTSLARPAPGGPARLRDLPGYRVGMTGAGAVAAARAAGLGASAPRALIQGLGAVGRGVARALAAAGARIVGVSDARACVLAPEGLDAESLCAAAPAGLLSPEALGRRAPGPPEALFGADADVLVLAALSRTVDAPEAARVRARLVVEAANFALTPAGRAALEARALVVPDVVASSAAAAVVARQLAARCVRPGDEVWRDTLAAVEEGARLCVAEARRTGVSPRAAHVARLLGSVRALVPDADPRLP